MEKSIEEEGFLNEEEASENSEKSDPPEDPWNNKF